MYHSVQYRCDSCSETFHKAFPRGASAPATIRCIHCGQAAKKKTSRQDMKPSEWIKWFRRRESWKSER